MHPGENFWDVRDHDQLKQSLSDIKQNEIVSHFLDRSPFFLVYVSACVYLVTDHACELSEKTISFCKCNTWVIDFWIYVSFRMIDSLTI